jgi:hypothetical protein
VRILIDVHLGEFADGERRLEPWTIAVLRTCCALISIGLLVAFAVSLGKEIRDETFSTRDSTANEPFDNTTKFGMVEMPSVLLYPNILSQPSFTGVSIIHCFKLLSRRS